MKNKWFKVLGFLIVLWLLTNTIILVFFSDVQNIKGNIAILDLTGPIVNQKTNEIIQTQTISATKINELLNNIENTDSIKGVILVINSPGGTALGSKKIADKIKNLNKPVVSVIEDIGTSGAYWIASSSDYIIADQLSLIGSVGVISSYLEYKDLFEKYGVKYQRLVSGKYKDIGTPFKELNDEEENILQSKVDKIHQYFLNDVTINRNLTESQKENISSALFYLGDEAKELSLIDELGDKKNAIKYLENKLNLTAETFNYNSKKSFLRSLGQLMSTQSYQLGRGFGSYFVDESESIRIST